MTILQRSTFSGTSIYDVRPRVDLDKDVVVNWLKDDAALYEQVTGAAVANAAGISATPHVHDGTSGALIRIPLHQSRISAHLERRSSTISTFEDYYSYYAAPMWIPTGVSNVLVCCTMNNRDTARTLQVQSWNDGGSGLALVDEQREGFFASTDPEHPTGWLSHPSRSVYCFYLSVTAGDWNVIEWQAWDGYYDPADNSSDVRLPQGRGVHDVMVLPVLNRPLRSPATYVAPSVTSSTTWKVPASHTSFDAHLIDVADRMLPSYILVNKYKNTALIHEVLTGTPVGNRASATYSGHNHKDDAGTSLDDAGDEIEQPLGSWGYGTCRPAYGDTDASAYLDADCPSPGSSPRDYGSVWSGRIMAPALLASESASTYREVFRHRFRLPAATAANIANSTGKIDAAVLFETDTQQPLARLSIGAEDATSFGTTATGSGSTTTGRQLVTVTGIAGQAAEAIQTLKVEIALGATKSVPTCSVLGTALAYVP